MATGCTYGDMTSMHCQLNQFPYMTLLIPTALPPSLASYPTIYCFPFLSHPIRASSVTSSPGSRYQSTTTECCRVPLRMPLLPRACKWYLHRYCTYMSTYVYIHVYTVCVYPIMHTYILCIAVLLLCVVWRQNFM